MSTGEPETKRNETRPRERRRLKLIESYGAFSDDRLQEVAQKIRGITSDNDTQPTTMQGDAPLASDEITQSITQSITQAITQCPSDETEGIKENQSLENAKLIDINPQFFTPSTSPNESPDGSPDGSPDSPDGSPNESPDGSPNESPDGSPNDSPDGSPNDSSDGSPNDSSDGSPNGSPIQLQLLNPSSADAGVLLTENQ